MDLHLLDKSPHVASLLVQLYDSNKIYNLVDEHNPDARDDILRAVADLFEEELDFHDEQILSDVLIGLMQQAEKALREAIADRLADIENVPLGLILHLANDEIEIASPVLSRSPVLSDLDLIYIVRSKGPDYWQAIATRENMGDETINALADTKDLATAIVLSENDRIILTEYAMDILSDIAVNSNSVAKPLLTRKELPPLLAQKIYQHVSDEVESYIDLYFEEINPEIDMEVSDVIFENRPILQDKFSPYMPNDNQIEVAKAKMEGGKIDFDTMIQTLKQGNVPSFIAEFCCYTGLSINRIHDFLLKGKPKGFAIACRAFDVPKSDFTKFYLLTHRARSKDGVVNQKDMVDMLNYFESLNKDTARRIANRSIQRETLIG